MIRSLVFSTAACLATAAFSPAFAIPFTVDQSFDAIENGINIPFFSPLGQAFTPTMSSLGVVQLSLENDADTPQDLVVNIRENGLAGTIIGSSMVVSLGPSFFPGDVEFDFSSGVPLTPGNLYAIDFVQLSGDASSPVFAFGGGPGSGALGGGAATNYSYFFREGPTPFSASTPTPAVPEPASLALCGLGMATAVAFSLGIRKPRLQ